MAVGWAVWKVMGKSRQSAGSSQGAVEAAEQDSLESDQEARSSFLNKSTVRWVLTSTLSLQLLVFVVLSIHHGKYKSGGAAACHEAPVVATFKLGTPADCITNAKVEFERNVSAQFANMKVELINVKDGGANWTQVQFALYPDSANRTLSTVDMDRIRGHLVKLFLRKKSIVLAHFGKVYDFQIDKLRGGITVVPRQPDASLSRRTALFNFTLLNSTLEDVNEKYKGFKCQLTAGLSLLPNEVLVTRLTNLNGSTTEPPVIIQTLVFKNAGHRLSHRRLKHLARHISKHPRNLGLNHTMFGEVHDLKLSPVLQQYLQHPHAPAPAPMHAPSPGPTRSPFSYYSNARWPTEPVVQVFAPAPVTTGVGFGQASSGLSDLSNGKQQSFSAPAPSPVFSAGSSLSRLVIVMTVLVASTTTILCF